MSCTRSRSATRLWERLASRPFLTLRPHSCRDFSLPNPRLLLQKPSQPSWLLFPSPRTTSQPSRKRSSFQKCLQGWSRRRWRKWGRLAILPVRVSVGIEVLGMIYDVTRPETFDYVLRVAEILPRSMKVLFIGSKNDLCQQVGSKNDLRGSLTSCRSCVVAQINIWKRMVWKKRSSQARTRRISCSSTSVS